jgi:hypothetical protein
MEIGARQMRRSRLHHSLLAQRGHLMKRTALAFGAAFLIGTAGCETKSPPGGPGAPGPNESQPRVTTPDNTFRITVPATETDLKQGESKTITIGITRGTNFDQDVKLEIANNPQGVTFKFDNPSIPASAKETHLTISASADAALGEHTIVIKATPARTGAGATTEFKIEVKKP